MKPIVALSLVLAVAAGCSKPAGEPDAPPSTPAPATAAPAAASNAASDPGTHRAEIEAWQKRRAEGLRREDGWLTLVGLHWLGEGENRFGSDKAKNKIVFPAGTPAFAGRFVLDDAKVTLEPAAPMTIEGRPVTSRTPLLTDADDDGPTIVQMGSIRFNVIKRGERLGVRVKDANSPTRTEFKGLEYYPIDPKWRVEARLEKYEPVKKVAITDVAGMVSESDVPGALVFTLDGKEVRLDPLLEGDQLFIIFRDGTSRDTTYEAGRYLYADAPGPDGKVVVDFNKAYNPPCAFTEFATCPLPPPQNRIPIRVEAGEKRYAGGH